MYTYKTILAFVTNRQPILTVFNSQPLLATLAEIVYRSSLNSQKPWCILGREIIIIQSASAIRLA
jgi:hypothetical protein